MFILASYLNESSGSHIFTGKSFLIDVILSQIVFVSYVTTTCYVEQIIR